MLEKVKTTAIKTFKKCWEKNTAIKILKNVGKGENNTAIKIFFKN